MKVGLSNCPISLAGLQAFLNVSLPQEASAEPRSLQAASYAQYVLCVIKLPFLRTSKHQNSKFPSAGV